MVSPLWLVCLFSFGVMPSGQIAFVSGARQDDLCVCIADVSTEEVTRLGRGQNDGAPVWSPDGARIAFESRRDADVGIYIVRADGSDLRGVPHAHRWNRSPAWSPDGTKLAYTAGTGSGRSIIVYNFETETEREWGGGRKGLLRPVWMKDGRIIAVGLGGARGGISTDLFLVTPDTAQPPPPEALPSEGSYAEWAAAPNPNGRTIAFESDDGGDREIFILSPKKGAYDVSNHRAADWNPVWAPDGKSLLFESFRGGRRGLYRVFPDTLRIASVTAGKDWDDWHPTWSPDGRWVAFVSNRTGDAEVFITDLSGRHTRQLTRHAGPDYAPAWRPERGP